jgi:hypothetical protein
MPKGCIAFVKEFFHAQNAIFSLALAWFVHGGRPFFGRL